MGSEVEKKKIMACSSVFYRIFYCILLYIIILYFIYSIFIIIFSITVFRFSFEPVGLVTKPSLTGFGSRNRLGRWCDSRPSLENCWGNPDG